MPGPQVSKDQLVRALALLEAGDWQAAHEIVQRDEDTPLACWAHGIVHLMEGDKSNARYWYREAKREFSSAASIADEIATLGKALHT
jgi:Tfp pilus assembly protein PilF